MLSKWIQGINEIQSGYWGTKMVSIFTSVVWYRSENDGKVNAKSFALVSDCIHHDKYSVHISLMTLIREIMAMQPDCEELIFFLMGQQANLNKSTQCLI